MSETQTYIFIFCFNLETGLTTHNVKYECQDSMENAHKKCMEAFWNTEVYFYLQNFLKKN